jgi:pyruvate dehydrogenase E1 component alpha subunit
MSRDEMLRAYRTMRTIRVFEDRVSLEMTTGDVPGNTHLYAGQEASAVGICFNLQPTDRIASTHRGHGHSIAKGIWQLPMIFAVEDNGFAEATSSDYATAGSIPKRGEAFDVPSVTVDGLDFFAVESAAREAIERGRTGGGPSLIHITTPRYYGHFSGDADTYRTAEEKLAMRRDQDCLKRFRAKVVQAAVLDETELDAIDREVDGAVDDAVKFARGSPRPSLSELTTHVYVNYP